MNDYSSAFPEELTAMNQTSADVSGSVVAEMVFTGTFVLVWCWCLLSIKYSTDFEEVPFLLRPGAVFFRGVRFATARRRRAHAPVPCDPVESEYPLAIATPLPQVPDTVPNSEIVVAIPNNISI